MAIDGTTTPWTNPKDYMYGDSGFLRIVYGITNTGGTLTATSLAKLDFTGVVASPSGSYAGAATEQEYYESKTATGVTLRIPNNAFTVDATTGYKTSKENTAEKFEVTVYCGWTAYKQLLAEYRAGNVVIACRGMGLKASDNSVVGYEHLCGKITEFAPSQKEEMWEIKLTISGGTSYTASTGLAFSDYNTIATGATNKIQPDGVTSEYTILELTASTTGTSFATLMTGVILQTAAS